jgi:hypothetical protein
LNARDIERAGFKWAYADQANRKLNTMPLGEPLIVNTDSTGGPGVHWVVMVRQYEEMGTKPAVFLYDPLGDDNERLTSDGKPSKLKYDLLYGPASQLASTDHCGYFAIYVADLIRKDRSKTADEYDIPIRRAFGDSPDWGDAKVAIQRAKRLMR